MHENALKARFKPYSFEAEQALLGALINDINRTFDKVQPIKADMFFDPSHKEIYQAIEKLHGKRQETDIFTVCELVGREDVTIDYLAGLTHATPGATLVKAYAQNVREKAQHREIIEAAQQATEIAESSATFEEKADKISTLFLAIEKQTIAQLPQTLAEIALTRTTHYEDLQSGKAIGGYETSLYTLNKLLNGGIREGGLYYLAARPSVGKSSLAAQIGLKQAEQGRKVLFLSQEMSKEEVADRAVVNIGRIDYTAIQTGKMTDDDWGRAVDTLKRQELENVYVDDQGGLTLADIRKKAKQIKGLKVLILDYLQLCSGEGANRNSEIEVISRGLKTLAKELKISVIALSQLNREVEKRADKKPMLADLRDSGSIEQDADGVWLLWPVREFDSGAKLLGLAVAKNRQGRLGEVALHFEGCYQQWHESSESLEQDRNIGKRNTFNG